MSCCSRPSTVSAGTSPASWVLSPAGSRSCSSRASRAHDRSSGWTGRSAVGSSRRAAAVAAPSATRSHSARDGCGSHRCTSRCAARASRTVSCSVVIRVGPNTDSRAGRSTSSGVERSRSQAGSSRSAGLSVPIAARTRRHSSACHSRSSSSVTPGPAVSRPAAQSRSMAGRCAAYPVNSAASFCPTATRRPWSVCPSRSPRCRPRVTHHGSAAQRSTTSSSTHASRCSAHGSSRGSTPVPTASASATTRAGDGNSTLAHTPSPVDVPNRAASVCVIHRSTPLDGTATTSGVNGSSGGVASSAPSPRTSASARSARWMCSVMDRPLRRHLDAGHDPRSWPGQFPDLHSMR